MNKHILAFHVLQRADSEFYWKLRLDGHIVCTSSEAYTDFGDCLAGLYIFRGRAAESPLNDTSIDGAPKRIAPTEFEIVCDQNGGFDWTFQQTTGKPLATGVAHPDKDKLLALIDLTKQSVCESEVIVDAEEPVDIESCAGRGHEPPCARRYRIRINNNRYVIDHHNISGRELLELAGMTPHDHFRLDQKLGNGGTKRIGDDDLVNVCAPGIERFMTIPKIQIDGAPAPAVSLDAAELRRQFDLSRDDRNHLNARGLPWETFKESVKTGIRLWLLIHGWPVPKGYNQYEVTVAIMIPPNYPTAQLDMAYFLPALSRTVNHPIARTSEESIEGQTFQRWSRHRTSQNPWRPGLDNIATHLSMVECWLERELEKQPVST